MPYPRDRTPGQLKADYFISHLAHGDVIIRARNAPICNMPPSLVWFWPLIYGPNYLLPNKPENNSDFAHVIVLTPS